MTDPPQNTNWMNAIVGFALFGFGGAFLYLEMKSPPTHTPHIILFASIAFIGALSIRPDPILMVIKQLVVIGGPFLPYGRRSTDVPPKDGAP